MNKEAMVEWRKHFAKREQSTEETKHHEVELDETNVRDEDKQLYRGKSLIWLKDGDCNWYREALWCIRDSKKLKVSAYKSGGTLVATYLYTAIEALDGLFLHRVEDEEDDEDEGVKEGESDPEEGKDENKK